MAKTSEPSVHAELACMREWVDTCLRWSNFHREIICFSYHVYLSCITACGRRGPDFYKVVSYMQVGERRFPYFQNAGTKKSSPETSSRPANPSKSPARFQFRVGNIFHSIPFYFNKFIKFSSLGFTFPSAIESSFAIFQQHEKLLGRIQPPSPMLWPSVRPSS